MLNTKKYEFTGETKQFLGKTVHRIQAVRGFGRIRAGELGGWIEKEENLSHCGKCWVKGNVVVAGNAHVTGNARVVGNTFVKGNAWVGGDACVAENARVAENAVVTGNAWVGGDACVAENARVAGNARVAENAWVKGNAWVDGNAKIQENAYITKTEDYLVVGPIGSRNDYTTFYKNRDNGISVVCGCFLGTIEEFLKAVEKTHGDSKYGKEYINAIRLAEMRIINLDKTEKVSDTNVESNEWISADNPPKKMQDVLCQYKDGQMTVCFYSEEGWWQTIPESEFSTACETPWVWRILPKAYQLEEEVGSSQGNFKEDSYVKR